MQTDDATRERDETYVHGYHSQESVRLQDQAGTLAICPTLDTFFVELGASYFLPWLLGTVAVTAFVVAFPV